MAQRPACQLEKLHRSGTEEETVICCDLLDWIRTAFELGSKVHLHGLYARHQLGQRNYFLINPKYPSFNVSVMIVRNVVDCEDGSVFLRVTPFGPKCRVGLLSNENLQIFN